MLYRVTLKLVSGGQYYARCEAGPNGLVEAQAASAGEALDRVRREIRYQLEYCPCSGVARDSVELEVRDLTGGGRPSA